MSTALQQKTCRDYLSLLGPFLDGELDAPGMLEVESHVGRCAPCNEHVELLRSTRASLKRTVRRNAPDGLRARLSVAMAAEATRGEVRENDNADRANTAGSKLLGWRTMVPLASAAALALAWGATRPPKVATPEQTAGFGDDLLAEIIAEHAAPLPPDATDPRAVRNLEKYVGVPVRPGSFERGGAKLVGGRVLPMRSATQARAAMLQFVVMNGDEPRRVSLFVYDPSKIQVVSPGMSPHPIGTARVSVGQARGYSVAVTQRGGIGCALATDMGADESAQLALAACDE